MVQSFVVRWIFFCLMGCTHFKSEAVRVRFMTISIFMIFFFNYGVMYLLAPIEIDIGPWNYINSGVYHDFNK